MKILDEFVVAEMIEFSLKSKNVDSEVSIMQVNDL